MHHSPFCPGWWIPFFSFSHAVLPFISSRWYPSFISQFSGPTERTTIFIESRADEKGADSGEVLEKALDSGYDGGEFLPVAVCTPACAGAYALLAATSGVTVNRTGKRMR